MTWPINFDPEIHGKSDEARINSIYTQMAIEAKKQYEDGNKVSVIHSQGSNVAGERMAYKIRNKPPRLWPVGRWKVVGRRLRRDGKYVEGSILSVTYLGPCVNDKAIIFEHEVVAGRPPTQWTPAMEERKTPTYEIAHVSDDVIVKTPDDFRCPVCHELGIVDKLYGKKGERITGQYIECTKCDVHRTLLRAKLPVLYPS